MTGHTYIVYGPLANGATQVMYEGTPNSPDKRRRWEIIEEYGVTIFYTAPTAIRTFMKQGREIPDAHDLSSLRLLGVGGRADQPGGLDAGTATSSAATARPIVDTWWQTETGAIMISPLPGVTGGKPGSAMTPAARASRPTSSTRTATSRSATASGGYLVLTEPWPSMLRGIWGDDERYKDTYWSRYAEQGWYFAGDGAKKDDDGDLWVLGRVDDVMNVSGHRISTTEIESALVVAPQGRRGRGRRRHGRDHRPGASARSSSCAARPATAARTSSRSCEAARRQGDRRDRQAAPDHVVPELPKTRSGKIMRRLLRDVAEDREVGDVTTLADPAVFDAIKNA